MLRWPRSFCRRVWSGALECLSISGNMLTKTSQMQLKLLGLISRSTICWWSNSKSKNFEWILNDFLKYLNVYSEDLSEFISLKTRLLFKWQFLFMSSFKALSTIVQKHQYVWISESNQIPGKEKLLIWIFKIVNMTSNNGLYWSSFIIVVVTTSKVVSSFVAIIHINEAKTKHVTKPNNH